MATLDSVFGGLKMGNHDLEVSFLGWHRVGSCTITVNSQYEFAATGSYSAMGRSGNFGIDLKLTDQNPTATSGPCTVTNAGQTLVGTYSKSGSTISFSDNDHTVTATLDSANVVLQVSGYPKGRILA